MNFMLHTPESESELSGIYKVAFAKSVELFLVTAYLTEWDSSLTLNQGCKSFRIIVGKDFGITRKHACETVLKWLPPHRKGQFKVADQIGGFHPKAVFWKEKSGECFAIIGSSNLTRAAFETNYEANVFSKMSEAEFSNAKKWVKKIEALSVPVSEDSLKQYREATSWLQGNEKKPDKAKKGQTEVVTLPLPKPPGMKKLIDDRRRTLAVYKKHRNGLMKLFRQCAIGEITPEKFYDELPKFWGTDVGDRLQGAGWERKGMGSDFQALAQSFVNIVDAGPDDRDDVVIEEIDNLTDQKVPTRRAFLSEMLCLRFPSDYPVLNQPVKDWLRDVKFKSPVGASLGVRYVDLAIKLRSSLRQNSGHPAKNLAELDTVIWAKYRR